MRRALNYRAIGGTIIALTAGGALGVLLSGGAGRQVVMVTSTVSRTVVQVRTVGMAHGSAGVRARRGREPALGREPTLGRAQARSAAVVAESRTPASRPRVFSGSGSASLGTVGLAQGAVLRWTNTSGHFLLLFDRGGVAVNSSARSGQLFAPAGTYRDVQINTTGRWTLRLG